MCLNRSVVSDSLWPCGLYSPPGSSVHGDSPGKNTGEGCYALLQGIFPTQGSNPGQPHCRLILYQLSHQGSPWPRSYGSTTTCPFTHLQVSSHESIRTILYSSLLSPRPSTLMVKNRFLTRYKVCCHYVMEQQKAKDICGLCLRWAGRAFKRRNKYYITVRIKVNTSEDLRVQNVFFSWINVLHILTDLRHVRIQNDIFQAEIN